MEKGVAVAGQWLFIAAIFPKKCRTHGPARTKGRNSGHENATFYGFIMRMVDRGNAWDET